MGNHILDFLQFSQKLTVITEHEWVPKPLCALIARINVIRNRFSHDRDDQHFTPEDEHAFRSIVGSFKYHEKFPISDYLEGEAAPPRAIIARVIASLHGMIFVYDWYSGKIPKSQMDKLTEGPCGSARLAKIRAIAGRSSLGPRWKQSLALIAEHDLIALPSVF